MLIRFSVENCASFRDNAELSLIASKETLRNETLATVPILGKRLLPTAAIYGGNASGKTNLTDALVVARDAIVDGCKEDESILYAPFILDNTSRTKPMRFSFEILTEDDIPYAYSFAITADEVVEESLIRIKKTTEEVMFTRKKQVIDINPDITKNRAIINGKDGQTFSPNEVKTVINLVKKNTPKKQLLLTHMSRLGLGLFSSVYNWFSKSLVFIQPHAIYGPYEHFIQEEHPIHQCMNRLISQFDTGISRIAGEDVPLDMIPKEVLNSLSDGRTRRFNRNGTKFVVAKNNGEFSAQKMIGYHRGTDGTEYPFEYGVESDGTKRVLDLLPAFIDLQQDNIRKIYIIDELDRSLHTLLTDALIKMYLQACSKKSRKQLIFTTHDVNLMDREDLLRRDEMWVMERTADQNSKLYSFSEFKDVRCDLSLGKNYLRGRMGGIPRIQSNAYLDCKNGTK